MDTSIVASNPNPRNPLQFMFEDETIRVITDENGEPLFVAADVCQVLGIVNVSDAMRKIGNDEKGITLIYTPGGNQNMIVINEPGLYRLIFRSDKPHAKKFQYWVLHNVLPSIRKTGSYTMQAPSAIAPSEFDIIRRMVDATERHEREIAALKWQQDALETNQQQLDSRVGRLEKRPRKDYHTVKDYMFDNGYTETPERLEGFEQRALRMSLDAGYEVQELEGNRMAFHKDVLKRL